MAALTSVRLSSSSTVCANVNHFVERRGFEVADGESARHARVPGPNVGHAHDVIEDAGHQPPWVCPEAPQSLPKNHGARDLVEFFLPCELRCRDGFVPPSPPVLP